MSMQTNTITIVGMRRTGISIALALQQGPMDFTLIGHDSDANLLHETAVTKAVDRVEADLIKACTPADIIVLAMPSLELEATLNLIGDRIQAHTLIIDLTALKGPGIRLAREHLKDGHYIGARPVFAAGTFTNLETDLNSARADLFNDSVFCVMPSSEADPKVVETAVRFGELLGSKPYFVDPLEYDQLAFGSETIPGVAAAALFSAVTSSMGWRDVLRFADIPFAVGTQPLDIDTEDLAYLLLSDRAAAIRSLDNYLTKLNDIRRILKEGDPELLAVYLMDLNLSRLKWLRERSENNWDEMHSEDFEVPSLSQHFLGGLASKRKES
jgi:prephenate dehydrogenase